MISVLHPKFFQIISHRFSPLLRKDLARFHSSRQSSMPTNQQIIIWKSLQKLSAERLRSGFISIDQNETCAHCRKIEAKLPADTARRAAYRDLFADKKLLAAPYILTEPRHSCAQRREPSFATIDSKLFLVFAINSCQQFSSTKGLPPSACCFASFSVCLLDQT